MAPIPRADLIGLVVSDMARSMAFYRRLGLVFTFGSETDDHTEAALPGGLRFALDSEASRCQFRSMECIGARWRR